WGYAYTQTGTYNVCIYAYSTGGCVDTSCYQLTLISDSVWPGDANADGVADIFDILPIGIAYGSTGPVRPSATNNWVAQFAQDYNMDLPNGVNYKHADCNGDGNINITDVNPILMNYGQTHQKDEPENATINSQNLWIDIVTDTAVVGTVIEAIINLGDNQNTVSNVYGLALELNYDPTLIDSINVDVDYSNSWLGNANNPNELITLDTNFLSNGNMDLGITRTNQVNMSGGGELCAIEIFTTDNLTGKQNNLYKTLELLIGNAKIIQFDGTQIAVNLISDSIILKQDTTALKSGSKSLQDLDLTCYPNPSSGMFNIKSNIILNSAEIFNLSGQNVVSSTINNKQFTIDASGLPPGIYILKVEGAGLKKNQLISIK
ncbi:MAG: T9SS type A sorting domain-containing protein, partial [Flavobacteriales bacterium]|nr:T9SS type A sorting domain-containing protein [Flavobacteriales bacterium]